jgi:hypothetical protein
MKCWDEIKDPADGDFYEVVVNADWLGDDVIVDATFESSAESELVFAAPGTDGNRVRTFITGGVEGVHDVEVTIETLSGRVRQRTVELRVAEL